MPRNRYGCRGDLSNRGGGVRGTTCRAPTSAEGDRSPAQCSMRKLIAFFCLVLFAACDNVAPTLTPTRPLSAPTLQASATVLPLMPAFSRLSISTPGRTTRPPPRSRATRNCRRWRRDARAGRDCIKPITVTAPDGKQLTGDLYASRQTDVIAPGILLLASQTMAGSICRCACKRRVTTCWRCRCGRTPTPTRCRRGATSRR